MPITKFTDTNQLTLQNDEQDITENEQCCTKNKKWEGERTDRISDLVLRLLNTKHTGIRRRMYRSDQRSCTPAIEHKAYRNEKTNVQIGSAILYSGYCTQSIQEWEDECTDRSSNLVLQLLYTKHTGMRRRMYRSDQRSCTPATEHKAYRNEKTNVQIGAAILYSSYWTQSTQEWEDECTDRISDLVLRLLNTKHTGMRRGMYRSEQRSCTPAIVHKAYRNEKTNVQIGSAILYSGYWTQSTQEWEGERTDRISDLVLRLLYTKHTGMRRQTNRSDQQSCTPAIVHKAHRFIWLEFTSERSD